MKNTNASGASQAASMRCAACGTREFTDRAKTFRPPNRAPGVVCERCLVFMASRPEMAKGVALAILSGTCLADAMPRPAPGVH